MDDIIVFAAILYLSVASFTIAVLPDDLFSDPVVGGFADWSSPLEIAAFLFVPIAIPGIPIYFSFPIMLLNIFCLFIGGLFVYNLIRGR